MSKYFHITCPECKKKINYTIDDDSEIIVCPHCNTEIDILDGPFYHKDDYVAFID